MVTSKNRHKNREKYSKLKMQYKQTEKHWENPEQTAIVLR
jgi:hypothetical protein